MSPISSSAPVTREQHVVRFAANAGLVLLRYGRVLFLLLEDLLLLGAAPYTCGQGLRAARDRSR